MHIVYNSKEWLLCYSISERKIGIFRQHGDLTGIIRGLWSQLGLIHKIETALELATVSAADDLSATSQQLLSTWLLVTWSVLCGLFNITLKRNLLAGPLSFFRRFSLISVIC